MVRMRLKKEDKGIKVIENGKMSFAKKIKGGNLLVVEKLYFVAFTKFTVIYLNRKSNVMIPTQQG